MDHFDSSSVSYLNPIEGIQFDGRSYALYGIINKFSLKILLIIEFFLDPNFKINDSFSIHFQIQTFAHDGLILWIGDPVPDSSFTIEIQNRQVRFFHHSFSFYFLFYSLSLELL
jgi:hypothetical protein